ncbi:MAG: glycosyltransferase family 2 protein [Desulfobacter sp.]|nr:MAG: glycosyltransferase family 2 protein [Desulfobacter sp.]
MAKKFSIIIATYNRAAILDQTLEHFVNLDFNKSDYELIIIDNNSCDDTKHIVEKFSSKLPIVYAFEKRQGQNFARNKAIEIANGELFVFTDDDITPQKNWLQEILSVTNRWTHVSIFGGRVLPVFPKESKLRITEASFSDFIFTNFNPLGCEGELCDLYPVSGNCWVRAALFKSGVHFNTTFGPKGRNRISGSEQEFFHRMIKRGEIAVFAPSVIVKHRIQMSQLKLKYLIKRAIAGGRGWVRIRNPFRKTPFLLGAPRFLYKVSLVSFGRTTFALLTGKNYLEPLLKLCEYVGCIYEYQTNKNLLVQD